MASVLRIIAAVVNLPALIASAFSSFSSWRMRRKLAKTSNTVSKLQKSVVNLNAQLNLEKKQKETKGQKPSENEIISHFSNPVNLDDSK